MASAVGNIFIGLHVDTTGSRAMAGVADSVVRQSNRMRQSLNGTGRSVTQLRSQMGQGYRALLFDRMIRQAASVNNELGKVRAAMLGVAAITGAPLGAAFGGAWLLQTADRAHLLRNQLATVTEGSENLLAVQEKLFELSQRTRSDMAATVMIYARTARAVEHLGKSQEDLLRVTETIQKAFAIGGASQAEARGAAIQLSQGIASDRFSGEEYRSVAENAPVLLRGMADAIGVNIGKLREMAHAGELTGEVVTNAILTASGKIDGAFDKVGVTAGQAFTRLSNAFLMYVGDVDTSVGATRALAQTLTNVAENFEEVVKWAGLLAAVIGGPILGRFIGTKAGQAAAGFGGLFGSLGSGEEGLKAKAIIEERLRLQKELVAMGARVGPGGRMSIVATQANVAQMDAFNKKLRDYNALTARAVMATETLAKSQRVLAVAGRVGAGVLGFLGGPVGVAFLALVGAMGAFGAATAASVERTRKLTEEMHSLGLVTDKFAGVTSDAARSLEEMNLDEIRVKIAALREEMTRQEQGRPFWEQWFNPDGATLADNISKIEALTQFGARSGFDRFSAEGFSGGDTAFLDTLGRLAKQVRDGEIGVEEFNRQWSEASRFFGEVSSKASELAVNIQKNVTYMEALGLLTKETESRLGAMAATSFESDKALARLNVALNERLDLEGRIAEIHAEMMRVAGLSEEEARVEKIIENLRKELDLEGEISDVVRQSLAERAREIVVAEDHADALKQIADLRKSMQVDGLTLIDRDAVTRVDHLLDQFRTGNMRVETMKSAMAEIANLRLSKSMDGLIEKIIAAIPQLAALLGIAQSFPGVGPQGQASGRGAVGRARRELEAKRGVGADSVAEALRVAGLGERDSFIESKAKDLIKDAKELGGALSMEAAKDGAARIYDAEQAMKAADKAADDAADSAKKFADGMAELDAQLALATLGDFVESVYDAADGMGVSRAELDAFIATVSAEGLAAAPQKFRDIADAMREIKAIEIMDDLRFEQAQVFRTDTEQRIYETLRDTGIEVGSVQGEMIANQIRFNDFLSESKDIALGFAETFRSALGEGKSWWEALADAGVQALDRIAAKLMEMAVMGLLEQVLGFAFGGIGGGGFSSQLGKGLTGPNVYGGSGGFFLGSFADGGAGRIPGSGPTDSVWAYARVTPGEPYAFGDAALKGISGAPSMSGGALQVTVVSEVRNGNLVPVMARVAGEVAGRVVDQKAPLAMARAQQDRRLG